MSSQQNQGDAAKTKSVVLHSVEKTRKKFHQVFSKEFTDIQARREACGLAVPDPGPEGEVSKPSSKLGLVGLALSGGGIRSASFSLGVVQALARGLSRRSPNRKGYLKYIDYLSTVSGGGYLGSCLSSLLGNAGAKGLEPAHFPLRKEPGEQEEPSALRHLRNGSNYLQPPGLLSSLGLPTIVLRGLVLNLLALLPLVYAAVLLTGLVYETLGIYLLSTGDSIQEFAGRYEYGLLGLCATLFVVLGGLSPFALMLWRPSITKRSLYLKAMSATLLLMGVTLVLLPALRLVDWAAYMTYPELKTHLSEDWLPWGGLGLVLVGAWLLSRRPQMRRALGIILATMAGPLILFCIYLALCIWQVDPVRRVSMPDVLAMESEYDIESLRQCDTAALVKLVARVAMSDESASPSESIKPERALSQDLDEHMQALLGREQNAFKLKAAILASPTEDKNKSYGYDVAFFTGDVVVYRVEFSDKGSVPKVTAIDVKDSESTRERYNDVLFWGQSVQLAWNEETPTTMLIWGTMFDSEGGLLLLLWVISIFVNARYLNINHTSPHGFYRDQLSKVFLLKWKETEEETEEEEPKGVKERLRRMFLPKKPETNDTLKLSELRPADASSGAPYHLINATVNLDGDTHNLRGRKGDFFLFSKHYIGSAHTEWCPTEEVEREDPHLNLGTAMAISAAAASPHMGLFTSRALTFLLMLLNIRLGYWLPNPWFINNKMGPSRKGWWHFWGPGPYFLLKEAIGTFSPKGRYVNVSDGGHIENLGVYELLRRRCKLIIAVDGEADPKLGFNGLGTLLRFARIDLGTSITLNDMGKLQKVKGHSQVHWVRGTIDYGQKETGTLLYLKASLTGDEAPDLQAYRAVNRDFPHESTADQFFSEEQLEVYRALGEHIADDANLRDALDEIIDELELDKKAQATTAVEGSQPAPRVAVSGR